MKLSKYQHTVTVTDRDSTTVSLNCDHSLSHVEIKVEVTLNIIHYIPVHVVNALPDDVEPRVRRDGALHVF